MSFGQPLLLENVEESLDPILDPVLDKLVQKSGRGLKVVLADKECEYSESFRMYMTCRMSNPHFSPELCAQCAKTPLQPHLPSPHTLNTRRTRALIPPTFSRRGARSHCATRVLTLCPDQTPNAWPCVCVWLEITNAWPCVCFRLTEYKWSTSP